MMETEDRLFQAFKAAVTRGALVELLKVHQDRVYNLCWQVLRHRQDAEDAAQDVLLKLAFGIESIPNSDDLRGWLYRVSIRTALDAWRRQSARRGKEARIPMKTPPLPDEARRSLFEAIESLDDDGRELIIGHYFEKRSMRELADGRGTSATAVWKRIEGARDVLKHALAGAGFTVAAGGVAEALESVHPVRAPAGLVGDKIIIALGGIAMGGTKTLISASMAVSAILFLVAGLAGGFLLSARASRASKSRILDLESQLAAAQRASSVRPDAPSVAVALETASPKEATAQPPKRSELALRLAGYAEWVRKSKEHRAQIAARLQSDPAFAQEFMKSRLRDQMKAVAGLRDLIFADPATFLEFLRAPGNEDCIGSLLTYAMGVQTISPWQDNVVLSVQLPFEGFPKNLMEGLLELLKDGTSAHRISLMALFEKVTDLPHEYKDQIRALMTDPSPDIQGVAISTVLSFKDPTPEFVHSLKTLADASPHRSVRQQAVMALGQMDIKDDQWDAYILERLEAGRDMENLTSLTWAMNYRFANRLGSNLSNGHVEERYERALVSALTHATKESEFKTILGGSFDLPIARVRVIFEESASKAPTANLRDRIRQVLGKISEGETRRQALSNLLYESR